MSVDRIEVQGENPLKGNRLCDEHCDNMDKNNVCKVLGEKMLITPFMCSIYRDEVSGNHRLAARLKEDL